MEIKTNEKLNRYFEICIKDAYKTMREDCNLPDIKYDPKDVIWYYIVIENTLLFHIATPYDFVTKRACFRINNNITKNFGFLIMANSTAHYYLDAAPLLYTEIFDAFTVNNGERDVYLCKIVYMIDDRYQKMRDAANKIGLLTSTVYNWEDFKKIYREAYGTDPNRPEIQYISPNLKRIQ